MSLDAGQIRSTRMELAENLRRSGLPLERIAFVLGLSEDRVAAAVALREPVDSVDVWAVRDVLVIALRR